MPPEDDTENMSPPRMNHIDVVHSEDIDGPTDFTQNLEYWMTTKMPNVTKPSHMTGQAKDDLEEYVSEDTVKHHEAEKKDSLMDSEKETPRKEDDNISFLSNIPSSSHATDAQSSTPKTVEHVSTVDANKRDFQASVEDHSDTPSRIHGSSIINGQDDMPLRVRESSSAIGATLRSPEFTLKSRPGYFGATEGQVDEESETVKSLRGTLEKLRQELDDFRTSSQDEIAKVKQEAENNACDHEEEQESQMRQQEREWQRRLSNARNDYEHRLISALDTANRDSMEKTHADARRTSNELAAKDSKIAQLEAQLEQQKQDLESGQSRCTDLEQERHAAVETHQAMLVVQKDAQRLQQRQEQAWHNERTELRDAKLKVQQKFDLLQAELANLTMEHAGEVDELTVRLEDAANATQRAIDDQQAAARSNIAELEAENTRLHTQLDNKDDEIDAISDELRRSRMMHKEVVEENDSIAAKLEKQKTLNEQAAREIQSLRSGNKILQAKLTDAETTNPEAIEKLEHQLEEANVARLEADEEVDDLKSELEAAKISVAAAEDALNQYKETSEQVNKAMDKRMKELMRAREAEWTKRMEDLKKEVGFRGQALLREWGRVEMGVSEPQAYRYQFV